MQDAAPGTEQITWNLTLQVPACNNHKKLGDRGCLEIIRRGGGLFCELKTHVQFCSNFLQEASAGS